MSTEYYDLDFQRIKERFKSFLVSKPEFADYNFEGSAVSSLLDVFAYSIMYQTFYLNMATSEMILSSATMTDNIHKISSTLNYIPKRKGAPRLDVTFQKNEGAANVTIPKYTKFKLDDTVTMITMEDITLSDTNQHTYTLFQGEIVTEEFISTREQGSSEYETFTLASTETVDNDRFYVFVDRADGEGGFLQDDIEWQPVRTAVDKSATKYFLDYFEEFSIRFDNGSIYDHPRADDKVRVVYLNTDGAKYNGATGELVVDSDDNPILATTVSNDVVITFTDTLSGGTSEDTLDMIKSLAPQFQVTQNRAVTENDYNTIVQGWTEYETLYSASIWGGEREALDENSKLVELIADTLQDLDLGHVYVTAINSDFSYLSEDKKTRLLTYFNDYKIMSIFLKFIYPNIVTINPDIKIRKKTIFGLSDNDIRNDIIEYLDKFRGKDKRFNKSNLLRAIDGIYGVDYSDVSFTLSCRVYHEDYKVIRLNNPVVAGTISGTINDLTLDDDGAGNIRFDGVNIGTINYASGFIVIDLETNPQAGFIVGADYYDFSFQFQNQYSMAFERETFLDYDSTFTVDFDTI